jgi:CBS domain
LGECCIAANSEQLSRGGRRQEYGLSSLWTAAQKLFWAPPGGLSVLPLSADPQASRTATEDMTLAEIAAILEHNRIKRVPIVRDGELVGIVSRSNLVQAMATNGGAPGESLDASRTIRAELLSRLENAQSWTNFGSRNVSVTNGKVSPVGPATR